MRMVAVITELAVEAAPVEVPLGRGLGQGLTRGKGTLTLHHGRPRGSHRTRSDFDQIDLGISPPRLPGGRIGALAASRPF